MGSIVTGTPFVGRQHELSVLRAALDSAAAGRGRLVWLVGDAGIGKTSVAEQLCAEAAARDLRSHWGRCWEGGGAPAYFPWIEVVRSQRRRAGRDADLCRALPDLARLLPELRSEVPEAQAPPSDQLRFRLFESFSEFFKRAAADGPLIIVLDDVQWADTESLLLLRFIARELPTLPLLLIGTYRQSDAWQDPGVARQLSELAADSQRLILGGLSASEVQAFVEQVWTPGAANELVREVHRITEGNPFFVDEVVRLLISQGVPADTSLSRLRIPEEVREAIRRRLRPLSPPAYEFAGCAAVIGQQFERGILAHTLPTPPDELDLALDELERAGVISPVADAIAVYRFAHTLVRRTLYESLPPATRMSLHAVIGRALESSPAASERLTEIAHHFLECALARSEPDARAADIERAADFACRAGIAAVSQLAYEQAAAFFERALQALSHWPAADSALAVADFARRRCEIMIALGDAQRRAGDLGKARATFRDAARLARSLVDETQGLAQAALGFAAASAETGAMDDELIRLLEEALERIGVEESSLRAAVLGRLSRALYFTPARTRQAEMSREAVALARRLGDGRAAAAALLTQHLSLWSPGTTQPRLEIIEEVVALAQQHFDKELELEGRLWRIVDVLECGSPQVFAFEIDDYCALAATARLPRYRWLGAILATMRSLCRDPLAQAEQSIRDTLALGKRSEIANAEQFFLVQLFALRQSQGRSVELRGEVAQLLEKYPALQVWRSALTAIHLESGNRREAQRELVQLGQDHFARLPRDGNWLPAIARLSEVSVALADRDQGAILYDLLSPYSECSVVIATGVVLLGSVSHYLGMLAHLLGRIEIASQHFEAALRVHESIGAPALIAATQVRRARLLQEAGGRHGAVADDLLQAAHDTAARLGLDALLAELDQPSTTASPVPSTPVAADEVEDGGAVFRIEDNLWHLRYRDTSVRLKDTKGLRALHRLLRSPGDRIAVTELADVLAGEVPLAEGASAEQLRINVTRAVNAALRRIDEEHPALARHLRNAIRTGQKCAYLPDDEAPSWRL